MRQSFLFILLLNCFSIYAQNSIEKSYVSGWGDTYWQFEFHKDGTYKRTSTGHYGLTSAEGTYRIFSDTLEILNGYQNTDRTVNRFYLMMGDSCIVDTYLRYGYKIKDTSQQYFIYSDELMNIKYPQIPTADSNWKKNLDSILNLTFNLPEIVASLNLDTTKKKAVGVSRYYKPSNLPIIASYYELNESSHPNFTIGGLRPIFLPAKRIKQGNYIEISDINQNLDEITVEFKIKIRPKTFHLNFERVDNRWKLYSIDKYDF